MRRCSRVALELACMLALMLVPSFGRLNCSIKTSLAASVPVDAPGVRVSMSEMAVRDPRKPTVLIIYATPNGNSIEQTLGGKDGPDWRYDIQNVAAQMKAVAELSPGRNVVLAVVEAEGKSWPAWRQKRAGGSAEIIALVEKLRSAAGGSTVTVVLTGHSGGGSLSFGFINGFDAIPSYVERIAFLDSNYAYSDEQEHGKKLVDWLRGDEKRRLIVVAYDDREIVLDGKKVVSETGGTYRSTQRMLDRFSAEGPLECVDEKDFLVRSALRGQAKFFVHRNPANKILHTALVGEMNGLMHALLLGTKAEGRWGKFGGPRAYERWMEQAVPAGIAARPKDARGGRALIAAMETMTPPQREALIVSEALAGNVPEFLRRFKTIRVGLKDRNGNAVEGTVEAMSDYLALGSDTDWVRMPMTPMSARKIAEAWGCELPTRSIVDAIWEQADVKLEPRPLVNDREAPGTFLEHHDIIEEQRKGKQPGLLVSGIKKDVVASAREREKPSRVVIYGWHKLDGKPIQPLTNVHKDTYVDYSHGVRLIRNIDPKLRELLRDE